VQKFKCVSAARSLPARSLFFLLRPLSHARRFLKKGIRTLAASVLFAVPFLRELALFSGCVDASRATAEKQLRAGYSVQVLPGGEREQIQTVRGREKLFLKARFGFVKLAIRFGAPLVPVYAFGASDLYYTSSFGQATREAIVSKIGVCINMAMGYGPFAPLRVPITMVYVTCAAPGR